MAAGGLLLATAGGFILHLLPGTILLIFSAIGYVVCVLLFAIMPENPNYWAYIFPAMIAATVGVDITYSTSNIFITTSMPAKRQGLAGALINVLVFLGISLFLGLGDIVQTATAHLGQKESYKIACWFGVGCAGVSLILLVGFVRIGKAKSDLTVDEKAELEKEISTTSLPPPPRGNENFPGNDSSTTIGEIRPDKGDGTSHSNAPSRTITPESPLGRVSYTRRPTFHCADSHHASKHHIRS